MPPKRRKKKVTSTPAIEKEHPLLVLELCLHLSRFVAPRDAIVCALVCKVWNGPFTSVVGHTVDLHSQEDFFNLDSSIIKKHGHRIRIISRVDTLLQVQALLHTSVCRLQNITIVVPRAKGCFYASCCEFLRQIASSITKSELVAENPHVGVFFPFDAISSTGSATSRVTYLKIENLPMTRNGFSSLPRMCPDHKKLALRKTTSYPTFSSLDHYQHTSLTVPR